MLAHGPYFGIMFFLLGSFNASFCPHTSGCRDQVIAENRIELDISEPEVSVTVMIPDERMLVLVCLLHECTWKCYPQFHHSFRDRCRDESQKERIYPLMLCFTFLGSCALLLFYFKFLRYYTLLIASKPWGEDKYIFLFSFS